jgi:hypothetical protein
MPRALRTVGCSLAVAAALAAGESLAAEGGDIVQPGDEKITVMLGAFLPAFRSKMQVDDQATPGDKVDLGSDLGMDENTSGGWLGAEWRFAPRHRIGFTYSRFTLSGERTIDRDLHIGDEVYPVGATLDSRLRLEIVPITYSYSLLKRDDNELALTAGLHWSRLSFRVEGSASLGARDFSNEATADADVPLPLFGLRYEHRFSERWSAGASGGLFALKFAKDALNFSGSLVSARVHAEYRMSRHFALGAALDAFKINVDTSQNDWHGGFEYGYWGPQVYLTARY